jgi:hypothetical protein
MRKPAFTAKVFRGIRVALVPASHALPLDEGDADAVRRAREWVAKMGEWHKWKEQEKLRLGIEACHRLIETVRNQKIAIEKRAIEKRDAV